MIKESEQPKVLINRPSIYVIDFGVIRKVGISRDFKQRLACLTSQFQIKPLRHLSLETEHNLTIERSIKSDLEPFLIPFGGIYTETFSTSFEYCARRIIKMVRRCKNEQRNILKTR